MNCPECNSEMSKKWHPTAARAMGGTAVTWECGVCGCELTPDKTKATRISAADTFAPTSDS